MFRGREIICISTSDWNMSWGSKQQLMLRLSINNRVLYVEYQASVLHLFFPFFLATRIMKRKTNPVKVNENLFVFTPNPLFPFAYYLRFVNKINQFFMMVSLRRMCRKINFSNPILWVYPPSAVDLVGKLSEELIIFHCAADFSCEKKNRLRNVTVSSMEFELARKSNIILTLTADLYKKYKKNNPNVYLFPSAVSFDTFSSALKTDYIPEDIQRLKKPRIGLVGYLDGKILDVDLLWYLVDKHPEWSLVLIGPKFRHIRRLKKLEKKDNVYFLGEKKNDKVSYYIKGLDVCIIPYVLNRFTSNVSSLKLYEYLALGKPVVSTAFADLREFSEVIRICHDKEAFLEGISLSLKEYNQDLIQKRLWLARENSWDNRINAISWLLEGAYKKSDRQ